MNYVTESLHDIPHMGPVTSSSIFITVKIVSVNTAIECVTSSAATILSRKAWHRIGSPSLKPVYAVFCRYRGPARFMEKADVYVQYQKV